MADVANLLALLDAIVDNGATTLIVIEHDLDVVARADWIIDAGARRGSASGSGQVVFGERPRRALRQASRSRGNTCRVADRGGSIAPDGPQHYSHPQRPRRRARRCAREMGRFGSRDMGWGWWRLALALVLVVAVLSAMAGAVADQLARPLERLAVAADRFGGGDLTVRTDVAGGGRRWVAREVRDVAVRFNRMAERVEVMVRGQREPSGRLATSSACLSDARAC